MARRVLAHDPKKATSPKPAPVETKRMAHPRIWATALKIAGGDPKKIVVESYSRVSIID